MTFFLLFKKNTRNYGNCKLKSLFSAVVKEPLLKVLAIIIYILFYNLYSL